MARQRSNEERFKIAYRLYKALCLRFPDLLIALSGQQGGI
jgi:hypothetical protein